MKQLTALLVVAVMVVSACGAVGLSATKAAAVNWTDMSAGCAPVNPAPGATWVLSGRLVYNSGNPVGLGPNKPIEIS